MVYYDVDGPGLVFAALAEPTRCASERAPASARGCRRTATPARSSACLQHEQDFDQKGRDPHQRGRAATLEKPDRRRIAFVTGSGRAPAAAGSRRSLELQRKDS